MFQTDILLLSNINLLTDVIGVQTILYKENFGIYRTYGEILRIDFLAFPWAFFIGLNWYGKYIEGDGYWDKPSIES